ncbi:ABC-type metal ion transport system, periplasmic component/surface antigen [Pseudomonas sp. GM84]|uniref:MetQ/NlpA family ABC transporter substrate-binding protein n=1 Tax=Pseudomonas sp. GM84 TaxID=1144340 RepID=UPI00026FA58D|nr:MetQ/NlpA family ABC transporter substrate-binding protein [Pseudomonas sp. GM84]EJN33930.1 ABC-type metal ion transport system, periplasmic component/surface antigen [Pseudomonas sp. GM84]
MKKTLAALATLIAANSFAAQAAEHLVVGATPVPHAEILEFVKPTLAKEGVDLDIKVFNDFIQPNLQLAQKNLDANYYQYRPFLDDFNKSRHTNLVPVVGVHIEPFGAYSAKYKTLTDLPDGASVAIPNDPVNTGRALVLLAEAGLISLKDPSNPQSTQRDITANPHHFKIRELEGAMLARSVKQVDLAFVFANYALEAGIDTNSALIVEKGKDLYVEYLVARPDNLQDEGLQKLAKALNSPEVRNFILTRYKGQIAPGF